MIFGPVLPVELVTSSRRARYFIVRVLYGAVLLLTVWTQYEISLRWRISNGDPLSPSDLAEFAQGFFESFAIIQVLTVLLLTPAMVAGTVSEEKERRTIEYLLVTDLRNHEIVLGKLAARLLQLIVLLAVGWPVLALLMLLGGVAMENVLAMFAITGSTVLAVASLSIWNSVQARRGRDAVMRVFLIGLALLFLPWIISVNSYLGSPNVAALEPILEQFLAANPFEALSESLDQAGTNWDPVWALIRNQAVLTIPCVALAVWQVRPVYLRQAFGATRRERRHMFRLWRPELGDSPVLWKELFAERPLATLGVTGLIAQWLLCLGVLVPAVVIFLRDYRNNQRTSFSDLHIYVLIVGTLVGCLALLMVAVRAAGSVTSERERQTWDVLLSTPLEPWEIVHGKVFGGLYAARGLLALLALLWVLGIVGGSTLPVILPIVLAELVILGLFAALLGLSFSLKLQTTLRAMAATVACALFVGGGYMFCCLPVLWNGSESEFLFAGCVPFLLGAPMAIEPRPGDPWRDDQVRAAFTCMVGNGMYVVGIIMLWGLVTNNFEDFVGRVGRFPSTFASSRSR